jgi:hypothetical protein
MSTRAFIHFTLAAILVGLAGCGHPQSPGAQCFSDATGLSLPPGTGCVASKTITVALVGLDTHYLKFQATNDMTPFLTAHFHPTTWDYVEQDMTPPPDWMKDLAFWNQSEIKQKLYYSGRYTNTSGTVFTTALSYDTNHNVAYFVGSQLRN